MLGQDRCMDAIPPLYKFSDIFCLSDIFLDIFCPCRMILDTFCPGNRHFCPDGIFLDIYKGEGGKKIIMITPKIQNRR